MSATLCVLSVLLVAILASPTQRAPLPPRYTDGLAGATFLTSVENGGVVPGPDGPDQYETVYIQAVDGELIFTQQEPTRICPCSHDFGAQNFTGYYVGGTNAAPTLQLFISSPGAQYVYIAHDLSLRYTLPGEPIPIGANGTSITLFQPEPLGGGLPSTSVANIKGHVTQPNGTTVYYNGYQVCANPDSPSGTENGVGPLKISATRTKDNTPDGNGIIDDHCISGFIENSINDPKVAPYDVTFNTPSEPLVFEYANVKLL